MQLVHIPPYLVPALQLFDPLGFGGKTCTCEVCSWEPSCSWLLLQIAADCTSSFAVIWGQEVKVWQQNHWASRFSDRSIFGMWLTHSYLVSIYFPSSIQPRQFLVSEDLALVWVYSVRNRQAVGCCPVNCFVLSIISLQELSLFRLHPRRVPGIIWRAKSLVVHLHHDGELVNCLAANGIEAGN